MFEFNIVSIVLFLFLFSLFFSCFYFDFSSVISKIKRTKSSDIMTPSFLSLRPTVFYKTRSIFSDNERDFYSSICDLLDSDYIVFPKVYFFDIFDVFSSDDNSLLNYNYPEDLSCFSFDFIIVRKRDFSVVLAVELNGSLLDNKNGVNKGLDFYRALKENGIYFIRTGNKKSLIDKIQKVLERV